MKYALQSAAPKKRAGNRRNALRIGLAGIAIAGVGAALTSAAWTDNVWFEAPVNGATFHLKASLTSGSGWTETSDTSPLKITGDVFKNLVPGDSRTVDVYVLNDSPVGAVVTTLPEVTGLTGVTVTATVADATLAPNASTAVTITVTTPGDWAVSNKGQTGTVELTVTGTTD